MATIFDEMLVNSKGSSLRKRKPISLETNSLNSLQTFQESKQEACTYSKDISVLNAFYERSRITVRV